jgi:hypothetical protein
MAHSRRAFCTAVAVLSVLGLGHMAGAQRDAEPKKPSLSLRANPPVGFSPLRVRLVVDVKDGANDHPDFYCPTIEWDWGDDLKSESSEDCNPYEAGKSSIRRRYSVEHVFRYAGNYKVSFRLKQKDRVVGSSTVAIQVRPGLRDDFGN